MFAECYGTTPDMGPIEEEVSSSDPLLDTWKSLSSSVSKKR
jgi:hypothetical protein